MVESLLFFRDKSRRLVTNGLFIISFKAGSHATGTLPIKKITLFENEASTANEIVFNSVAFQTSIFGA